MGVAAAQKFATLAKAAASEATPAQVAIAWVTQQPGVTVVIPGARNVDQARANAEAGKLATRSSQAIETLAAMDL
jgi:aryl-alcohol dehydrogenase-like predicted oxidoreductase